MFSAPVLAESERKKKKAKRQLLEKDIMVWRTYYESENV
jgi:hypothetical protein